jgi:Na+/H+-dicarboxylate symporter
VSLTIRVLIALVAGLALGTALSGSDSESLRALASAIEPLGTLWVNAIRMTVIPLIVSSLIAGIASAPDTSAVGRVGGRALIIFFATLAAAAVFSALVAPPLLAILDIGASASDALRGAGESTDVAARSAQLPTFRQWLVDLIPQNPIRAAADGAILPLIVFSVVLGLAFTRIPAATSAPIVRFFQGLSAAMLVLVRWVLALAPIGVFGLAVPLAMRLGMDAAEAVVKYVVLASALCAVFIVALYPVAAALGRVPIARFARATLPAQAVAFSSRSSLAALPAMIDGAQRTLGLSPTITSFFLPLSASVYRIGTVIGQTVGVLFLARLYGGEIEASLLATVVVTSVLTSFSVPGIPGGSILVMVPVLLAAGLPVDGVGILLGVDTIPDMFRTTTNVTGHMAAAAILGRDSAEGAGSAVADVGAPEAYGSVPAAASFESSSGSASTPPPTRAPST